MSIDELKKFRDNLSTYAEALESMIRPYIKGDYTILTTRNVQKIEFCQYYEKRRILLYFDYEGKIFNQIVDDIKKSPDPKEVGIISVETTKRRTFSLDEIKKWKEKYKGDSSKMSYIVVICQQ